MYRFADLRFRESFSPLWERDCNSDVLMCLMFYLFCNIFKRKFSILSKKTKKNQTRELKTFLSFPFLFLYFTFYLSKKKKNPFILLSVTIAFHHPILFNQGKTIVKGPSEVGDNSTDNKKKEEIYPLIFLLVNEKSEHIVKHKAPLI